MIVSDQREIDLIFEREKGCKARLVTDCLWFRRAITVEAVPYAIKCGQEHVFLWQGKESGISEIWGGAQYCENDGLPCDDEGYDLFMSNVMLPFWCYTPRAHVNFCGQVDKERSLMMLDVSRYSSIEEYVAASWSGKRRRSVMSDIKPYFGLNRRISGSISVHTLDFLFEKGAAAAAKMSDRPTFENGFRRAALLALIETSTALGYLRCLEIFDSDKLVAAELFIEHEASSAILSIAGHSCLEYKSLGKMLYYLVIERAIKNRIATIDVGSYVYPIKLLFRYVPQDSYFVDIEKRAE